MNWVVNVSLAISCFWKYFDHLLNCFWSSLLFLFTTFRNCTRGAYRWKPNLKCIRETKVRNNVVHIRLGHCFSLLSLEWDLKIDPKYAGGGSGDGRSKSRTMATGIHDQETSKRVAGDSTSARIPESKSGIISSAEQENVAEDLAAKKRPKLYWGYSAVSSVHICSFYLF